MINVGIVCDISWDNYILIHNKFKKLSNDNCRLHLIYNKNLQMMCNCAYNNNLTIMRNSGSILSECASNLLKICDVWIIFTNYTEYLTLPQLIITKCNEFNIKHIIISEQLDDYYSFINIQSFKKTINNLEICLNKVKVEKFNDELYNENFLLIKKELNLTPEIILSIRNKYENVNTSRQEKSIRLLYNKDDNRLNKLSIKGEKEFNSLMYASNRINYYNKN